MPQKIASWGAAEHADLPSLSSTAEHLWLAIDPASTEGRAKAFRRANRQFSYEMGVIFSAMVIVVGLIGALIFGN